TSSTRDWSSDVCSSDLTFTQLLRRGDFVVTAELNPPKSAAAQVVRRRASILKGYVDAVNVTDSNRAVAAMAAIPAAVIARETGRSEERRVGKECERRRA